MSQLERVPQLRAMIPMRIESLLVPCCMGANAEPSLFAIICVAVIAGGRVAKGVLLVIGNIADKMKSKYQDQGKAQSGSTTLCVKGKTNHRPARPSVQTDSEKLT